jgi:transcription antitermination factor NusG
MIWQVVTVNSRMEIETASRINSTGFIAHCPTYVKKIRHGRWAAEYFRTRVLPLFPTYIFIRPDDAFRKDIFEDSKTRLYFLPNGFVTDDQMTGINAMANKLTLEGSRTVEPINFKPDEIVQVLHAAMAGKPVKVLEVLRKSGKLRVQLTEHPGSMPFVIDSTSVARAV